MFVLSCVVQNHQTVKFENKEIMSLVGYEFASFVHLKKNYLIPAGILFFRTDYTNSVISF